MAAIATATESELLLYRVLQRANLTQYFETFIQQGGDDIGQLCEAGEEEFLEIMALVGMAAKPLHVRRLQKSLQEWVTNPALFAKPIGPSTPHPPIASGSIIASVSLPQRNLSPCVAQYNSPRQVIPSHVEECTTPQIWPPHSTESVWTPKPDSRSCSPCPVAYSPSPKQPSSISVQPITMATQSHLLLTDAVVDSPASQQVALPVFISEPAPIWKAPGVTGGVNGTSITSSTLDQNSRSSLSPTPSTGSDTNPGGAVPPGGCVGGHIPLLNEQQLTAIECAAEALANDLPEYEVRKLNMKKDINREIIEVINMDDENPEKMTLLRKYSAIYARFDSKRKNEGKMSLHEVSVNEASAQLCRRIPALLTRRDDLYPLSRRIVRDSGYQYSKGHSRATTSMDIPPNKKLKMESTKKSMSPSSITTTGTSYVPAQYENRVSEINKEINDIISQQEVLKSEISRARESDDKSLLESLRNNLEKCQGRQLQLRMEQSGIVGSGRSKNQKCRASCRSPLHVEIPASSLPPSGHQQSHHPLSPSPHKPHSQADSAIDLSSNNTSLHGNGPLPPSSTESEDGSDSDCCVLDLSGAEAGSGIRGRVRRRSNKKGEVKDASLLDEGLRIAQQYGMCDLAAEIEYMKDEEEPKVTTSKVKAKETASGVKDNQSVRVKDTEAAGVKEKESKVKDNESAGVKGKDSAGVEGKDSAGVKDKDLEEIDEQEEWNKEVERDMVKLKTCDVTPQLMTAKRGVRTRSATAELKS